VAKIPSSCRWASCVEMIVDRTRSWKPLRRVRDSGYRDRSQQKSATPRRDPGPANSVYAPASERVAKPPLREDQKLIDQHRESR